MHLLRRERRVSRGYKYAHNMKHSFSLLRSPCYQVYLHSLKMCSSGPVVSSSDGGNKYFFAIDRGGTFTDVLCICPGGRVRTIKLLSEDPERYSDAPREGIRRILKEVSSRKCKTRIKVAICISNYDVRKLEMI